MSLLYRQPFKGLYLTSSLLVTLCVRLPFWVTIALLPATRPRRAWTVKRCVYVRLFTYFMGLLSKVGRISKIPDYLDLVQGLDIDGVWINPLPARLLSGEIKEFASKANVEPVRIPGYWIHKPGETIDPKAAPQPGEKVVYALHGGAYVVGSASPKDPTSNIAKGLLQYAGKNGIRRVFSAEYRLAHPPPGEPAAPFPAALLDAIAGYAYLVQVAGFSPENIIVEGDSAGGNLALALVRYLVEEQVFLASAAKDEKEKALSPPGGILLMSPWSDLGSSHDKDPAPYLRQTDYVGNAPRGTAKGAQTLFAGTHGLKSLDTNRWISPASLHLSENEVSFSGWPRTFLACGGVEYLAPQIKVLRNRMIKDMGNGTGTGQVLYYEAPEAIHDWCTMPWCEPERSETLQAISDWIEKG